MDTTDKSITAVLSGAVATSEPDWSSHWGDATNTPTFIEGSEDGTFNGTTPVTLVSAPAASTRRIVNQIVITNVDTAAVTITINLESGANTRRLWYGTLETNETMTLDGSYDDNGALKTAIATIPAHSHTSPSSGGTLDAGLIFSAGTVKHEYGGLEADVSAFSGLVKITGGATSAVTAPSGAIVGTTDTQTLDNKTFTTPTIASFANATHNHTDAAGGGQITDAALSAAVSVGKGGLGITTTPTNGQIPIGNGTNYVAANITGNNGISVTNGAGTVAIGTTAAWHELTANTFLPSDGTIDLTSISGSYDHLVLMMQLRSDRAANSNDNVYIRLNNDSTASNYYGLGDTITTVIGATERLGVTATGFEVRSGATAATSPTDYFAILEVWIYNYAVTSRPRMVRWQGYTPAVDTTGGLAVTIGGGTWKNTSAAVDRVTIVPVNGTNFKQNSSYALYGIGRT